MISDIVSVISYFLLQFIMYLQGKKVGQFPLKAGDDAANICWMKLQADNCIITHMYISRFS